MSAQHTPTLDHLKALAAITPVRHCVASGKQTALVSASGARLTYTDDDARHMELVAHCVNSHAALLAAAEAAEQCIGELSPTQARAEAMQMIQAALKAAKGEA